MVVTMFARHFNKNHEVTSQRQSLLLIGLDWYTACLGPHREVTGRKKEREKAETRSSAFIGVQGGASRVSQVLSLLINLKCKSGN